jgi:hypothetical protein
MPLGIGPAGRGSDAGRKSGYGKKEFLLVSGHHRFLFDHVCLSSNDSYPPPSLISFSLTPSITIPLGEDTSLYTFGGALGYSFVPLQAVTSLSLVNGGIAVGVRFDILSRLSIQAFGTGGYFFAFLNDGSKSGADPFDKMLVPDTMSLTHPEHPFLRLS